jgi:hypothetical protein
VEILFETKIDLSNPSQAKQAKQGQPKVSKMAGARKL